MRGQFWPEPIDSECTLVHQQVTQRVFAVHQFIRFHSCLINQLLLIVQQAAISFKGLSLSIARGSS